MFQVSSVSSFNSASPVKKKVLFSGRCILAPLAWVLVLASEMVKRFEDLKVWQASRGLSKDLYILCRNTNLNKDFELKNQLLRSAGSVPDNIAEGFERDGNKELIHFLSIAKGSCGEVRSQLYRTLDHGHITPVEFSDFHDRAVEISRMLSGFISYLKSSSTPGRKFK